MRDERDLERLHRGDPDFFRELIDELSPRLLGAAWSFANGSDHAHDLVQATWVKAWERRTQFRGEGDLTHWIVRILYRVCLQDRRDRDLRHRLTRLAADELTPSIPENPASRVELAERMAQLHDGLARLSAQELEIALLTFRDGLTSVEVGEKLRISASTVRVHVANVRKKLKEHRKEGS